jgi:hypothetical protein
MKSKLIRDQIDEMFRVDQALRFSAAKNAKKSPKASIGIFNYMTYLADGLHNYKIKEMIRAHGYPSVKMVGREGLHKFWLLIQHQDQDILLQKQCFKKCVFSSLDAAYLEDRILLNDGKKQVYGTQFTGKFNRNNRLILRPTKDITHLNDRRKRVGLKPLSL